MNDDRIKSISTEWVKVKKNRRSFIQPYVHLGIFEPSDHPSTILTAGCTGAGKTEFAKRLLSITEKLPGMKRYVRADADELYHKIKQQLGIEGDCRDALNFPCIKLVEAICDNAIAKKQNLLIDSSFSQPKALDNVARSLRRGRTVHVHFIYEQPKVAWNYVLKRERIEGRSVPIDFFVQTYIGSIDVVTNAIERFGNQIIVDIHQKSSEIEPDLLIPEFERLCRVSTVADFDEIITRRYNSDDLLKEISSL